VRLGGREAVVVVVVVVKRRGKARGWIEEKK